jgi:hypothetical protein
MNWTGQITSSAQGLVIDDETGRNIAVAYDPKHTSLIAAAPELLEALQYVAHHWPAMNPNKTGADAYVKARTAIEKATGEVK